MRCKENVYRGGLAHQSIDGYRVQTHVRWSEDLDPFHLPESLIRASVNLYRRTGNSTEQIEA